MTEHKSALEHQTTPERNSALEHQSTPKNQASADLEVEALDVEAQRLITDMTSKENLGPDEIAANVRNSARSLDTIHQLIKSIKKI